MKVLKTALSSVITLALIINLAGCSDSNVSPSLPESSNETTVSSTASDTTSSTEESTAPQTEGTTASTASSELTPPTEESKAPETEATSVITTTSKATSTREESKTPESSKTTTVTTTSKTTTTKEENKTPVSSTKTTKDDNKTPEKEEDEDVGFITVDGKLLRDENNKEYIIKGIAFGNNVWANPETPPENRHHTEESYKELAELGFNSVRFYLNYGLFESDDNPYVYNEAGFEWLDKNIAQAKKYGIKLLLNMHYPQGGYQSQGDGNALWLYKENQNRLTALWTEIARRYSDEPTILGYGIVNEPVVAIQTDNPADALKLWQKVAQQITNGIRTVDNNHLIFVEKMCAVSYANTGKVEWDNFNDENNYVRINDANVVYEFHYYDPHKYTHQGFDWANTLGYDYTYPDKTLPMSYNSQWVAGTFGGDKAELSNNDWQYLESSFMTIDNEAYKMVSLVFQAAKLGEGGRVYADNIKLDEYDENGNFIKTVYFEDFSDSNEFYFWASNGEGSCSVSSTVGYDDNTSLCIENTTDDSNSTKNGIVAVYGHKYKVSGYFKVEKAQAGATIRPRADVYDSDPFYVLDKEYLEYTLLENIKFSKDNNVPVYCGEFGAGANCFTNGRGGTQWVSDVIDIFIKHDISFNYHAFHEGSFGLYQNSALSRPAQRNEALYNLFAEKLSGI